MKTLSQRRWSQLLAWMTAVALLAALWVWAPHAARLAGLPLTVTTQGVADGSRVPVVSLDACDLTAQTCTTLWPDPWPDGSGRVAPTANGGAWEAALRLTPQPVPMLAPITIELILRPVQPASTEAVQGGHTVRAADAVPPETLQVDFSGVEMFMGINRATLTRDADTDATSRDVVYRGVLTLPLCTTQRMTWNVTVLHTDAARADASTRPLGAFALTTDRRHVGWSDAGRRALDALLATPPETSAAEDSGFDVTPQDGRAPAAQPVTDAD